MLYDNDDNKRRHRQVLNIKNKKQRNDLVLLRNLQNL